MGWIEDTIVIVEWCSNLMTVKHGIFEAAGTMARQGFSEEERSKVLLEGIPLIYETDPRVQFLLPLIRYWCAQAMEHSP